MSMAEQILNRGMKHVLETQKKNACVMVNDQGQEVQITKAMVVVACQQLLNNVEILKIKGLIKSPLVYF